MTLELELLYSKLAINTRDSEQVGLLWQCIYDRCMVAFGLRCLPDYADQFVGELEKVSMHNIYQNKWHQRAYHKNLMEKTQDRQTLEEILIHS